jgi:hypothetical protein
MVKVGKILKYTFAENLYRRSLCAVLCEFSSAKELEILVLLNRCIYIEPHPLTEHQEAVLLVSAAICKILYGQ